jgi:hypothetical protein
LIDRDGRRKPGASRDAVDTQDHEKPITGRRADEAKNKIMENPRSIINQAITEKKNLVDSHSVIEPKTCYQYVTIIVMEKNDGLAAAEGAIYMAIPVPDYG